MDAKQILKLVDAGFTKAEIFELAGKQAPDKVPDPKPETPPAPEKVPDPKPETPPTSSGVTMSDDQFKTLLQQLNVQGASLDVPPEMDMSQKLGEHFKDLMIGK